MRMKRAHYGIIGTIGALVGTLLVMVAIDPPAQPTAAPDARFALFFQTDAGGYGLPFRMVGLTFKGRPLTVASLSDNSSGIAYDLDEVGSGRAAVPRLFLANLPSDLESLSEEKARKVLFFKVVLPLVLYANEEVLADRERLWRIRYEVRRGVKLSPLDRLWLIIKTDEYQVAPGDLDELARRLDIVPPSVALAQAAMESGWGTSALVRQRNALFSLPATASAETAASRHLTVGLGLTPDPGNFDNLLESVRAYVRNLNVHPAYEQFREERAHMRSGGTPVDGMKLAPYLKAFSEQGDNYLEAVQTIIEANGLRQLDDARLQFEPPAAAAPST